MRIAAMLAATPQPCDVPVTMKKTLSALVLLASSTQVCSDTLIHNAIGYTLDASALRAKPKLIRFEALLFSDAGKVLAIGSYQSLRAQSKSAALIDAKRAVLLPGLIDAHGHVMGLGQLALSVDLSGARSMPEALQMVADFAAKNPDAPWIVGRGWNQVVWGMQRFPTAAELDAIEATRPVLLERVDGHASWLNSVALSQAGINKETKDPSGGRIEREADGTPSGVLIDAAADQVTRLLPAASKADNETALRYALGTLNSVGLTSVHDAGTTPEHFALFSEFAEQGALSVRINAMIAGSGQAFSALAQQGPQPSLFDDLLSLKSVKIYMDGALGSRGAALIAPYADAPTQKGLLFADDRKLSADLRLVLGAGFQANVHAIGDLANRATLDSFARVQAEFPKPAWAKTWRNRIEHAQVLAVDDIARFAPLAVIASVQPTHATSDKNMAQARLGAKRMIGAYAWRRLLDANARMAGGSDFPVESSNPFFGWHAAVTRQDQSNAPKGGWRVQEALTRIEAFRLFTLDAAYAGHQEHVIGSLEPGKYADFILLDRDPFRIKAKDIWRTQVLSSWVAGKRVFQK
jgi:predicted amidohydrolase YtcJ